MSLDEFLEEWNNSSDSVLVHTSGSTGQPKAMLAEKHRMEASARITCRFLGLSEGDTALLCLPLDYIAGKMMVVRALTCGLQLVSVPPSGHPLAGVSSQLSFAAMVPLQVYNSLQVPAERETLRRIRHLIIGGGAIDAALASELVNFPNHIWSTYGMTETLSHIALRKINGVDASEWYKPFEGVSLSLSSENCLVIDAPAVCGSRLVTNDIAELQPDGRFRILGRKDNVICSGGVKIQIEEVEALLRQHISIPFVVTKVPDVRLGQQMVILLESADTTNLYDLCRNVLPQYWQPRRIISVDSLPMTATGKPARAEAERIATKHIEKVCN